MNESDVLICPPGRGYAEERQYATTIFRAQDGTETRENDYQSGEDGPIRVVDFPMSPLTAAMAALIDNTLAYAAEGSLLVPLWFSMATATQAVSGSRVYCDTRFGEFAAAEQVLVLTADLSAWEYRTIDAVADTYVDVPEAFTGLTFAAGAIVVPIIEVFPQGETQTSFVLDARRSVNYRVEELVGMAKMSGMFTPSTYSGYPFLTSPRPDPRGRGLPAPSRCRARPGGSGRFTLRRFPRGRWTGP